MEPLLVINLDVKDNHEEAAMAAPLALKLCEMVSVAYLLVVHKFAPPTLFSFLSSHTSSTFVRRLKVRKIGRARLMTLLIASSKRAAKGPCTQFAFTDDGEWSDSPWACACIYIPLPL